MKNNIKPTLTLSAICVAVALLLSVINMVTAPIIEAQRNAAASGALLEVFPGGSGFEEIDVSALGLPSGVTNAYCENSGKGYVFRVVSNGYKPGMVIMVGIDSEGKITGSKCIETQDTFGKEPMIDNSYNGQSLSDFTPNMISGATMTSSGYRDAVNAALQAFVLTSGGKLSDDVILEGLIPTIAPRIIKPVVLENVTGNITKAFKSADDAGYAYIISKGESSYLAVVYFTGECRVYDVEGNDVTADNADVAAEAIAANEVADFSATVNKMITSKFVDATEITEVEFEVTNSVLCAATFKSADNMYYAIYSRPLSYEDSAMDILTVIDENGAIVTQIIKQMAFGHGVEYMTGIKDYVNSSSQIYKDYLNKFSGLTEDTLGDDILIAGGTVSSSAVKLATKEAFAAFNSIKGGEQ